MADSDALKSRESAGMEETPDLVSDIYRMLTPDARSALVNLPPGELAEGRLDKSKVDELIAELDKSIGLQMDEILHHSEFQRLESAWRSIKFLVEQTDFENIWLELVNVTKDDLIEDFKDAPSVEESGWYHRIYRRGMEQFGAIPVGAIIGNFEFGKSAQDIELLDNLSKVSAMAHAPFIASLSPRFFDLQRWEQLGPKVPGDLADAIRSQTSYTKWRSFRENEDARYVVLTLPRFLLRLPYDPENQRVSRERFRYEENVSQGHESYLWGNTAFALAGRITESFAKYGWWTDIVGPRSGGAVEDLKLHEYKVGGKKVTKIPTEVLIPDGTDRVLSDEGFISLLMRENHDNAAFFSASTALKPRHFEDTVEGHEAERNFRMSTRITYMSLMNRLAHYLKVWQREEAQSWKSSQDLQGEINKALQQWVKDQEGLPAEYRSRHPFREARVEVEDVEQDPGWYRARIYARPHFKYEGLDCTMSLVSKLPKESRG